MDTAREQNPEHQEPFFRLPEPAANVWNYLYHRSWEIQVSTGVVAIVLILAAFEYRSCPPIRDVSVFVVQITCATALIYSAFKVATRLDGADWTLFPTFGGRDEDESVVFEQDTPRPAPVPAADPPYKTASDNRIPPTSQPRPALRRPPPPTPVEHHSGILGPSPHPNKFEDFRHTLGYAGRRLDFEAAAKRASYFTLKPEEKKLR